MAENIIDNDMIIKFEKTYEFEGEKIDRVDMSGIEDITVNDMIKANKILTNAGNISVMPETSLEYAIVIASFATGKPIEFFKQLIPKDGMKIKNKVMGFTFAGE